MSQKNALIPDPDQWLFYNTPDILLIGSVLTVGLCFFLWFAVLRPKPKQKRKRIENRRKPNPTLAQTGGLPPPRDPEAPPRRT